MRKMKVTSGQPDLIADCICQHVLMRPIHLSEEVRMHLDQVVVGMGEVVSELLSSKCLHHSVLKAHLGCVGASQLERGELCGRVLLVVDGELCQTKPVR